MLVRVLAFVAVAVSVLDTPAIAQPALPRVHLVATGGTISNRTGGRLTAEELAKSMPGLDRVATLTYEQFLNVASSQITLDQCWGSRAASTSCSRTTLGWPASS
jgi:L-asparaginase/Glu-tRNA(Gln) amidotransferase subunit D